MTKADLPCTCALATLALHSGLFLVADSEQPPVACMALKVENEIKAASVAVPLAGLLFNFHSEVHDGFA